MLHCFLRFSPVSFTVIACAHFSHPSIWLNKTYLIWSPLISENIAPQCKWDGSLFHLLLLTAQWHGWYIVIRCSIPFVNYSLNFFVAADSSSCWLLPKMSPTSSLTLIFCMFVVVWWDFWCWNNSRTMASHSWPWAIYCFLLPSFLNIKQQTKRDAMTSFDYNYQNLSVDCFPV